MLRRAYQGQNLGQGSTLKGDVETGRAQAAVSEGTAQSGQSGRLKDQDRAR